MEWYEGRARIKLTGHRSAQDVEEVFASRLVDVACIAEVTSDAVFIVADDPDWPTDPENEEWLCSLIKEVLAEYGGINDIELSFIPVNKPAK